MCGICGVANYAGAHVEERIVVAMRDALTHRGPDEAGIVVDGSVGLGHRRLSIIDLSTGSQPMHNEDSTIWIVFNGEIYNYQRLREDLLQAGHVFYTNSDTETLIHLYEEYGIEMLQKINGMFAFCIWDSRNQELVIARDRLGQKPLYYTCTGSAFLFASELKSLFQHPAVSREIDVLSLSKYLTYEYVPAPHSIIKNVHKLQPGCYLVYSTRTKEILTKEYWDIPLRDESIGYMTEEDYAEELLRLLKESVRYRLMSDVPIGIFLSGGLDSSTITALASELTPHVKTFSIGFDEKSFDESNYASQIAQQFGTDHYTDVLDITKAYTLLPDIMRFLDEPLGDASILPTFLLSRFTRHHVTVALGGDGGDELFAGYPTYQSLRLIDYYNIFPRELRAAIHKLVAMLPVSHNNISFDFKLKQMLRGAGVSTEVMFFLWMGAFTEHEKKSLFTPDMYAQIHTHNPFEDLFAYIQKSRLQKPLERALYLSTKLYLQDDILVKVDRASMANSLEARAPFLDHRVAEFAAKLPSIYKLNRLTTKYLLKKASQKILPGPIVKRKKKGFGIPVSKWLYGDMRSVLEEYFDKDRLRKDGLFDAGFIRQLLQEHWSKKKDNRKLLWTLLIFQMWKEKWIDN